LGVSLGQLGIVELDERGARLDAAAPLTDRFVGSNAEPVWSPEGEHVAYFSTRAEAGLERTRYLVVRTLEDGSERDFELDMGLFLGGHRSRPQWSADGRSVLFQGVDRERTATGVVSHPSAYRVDLETAEVHREPHMWSSQSLLLDVTGRQSDRLRSLGIRIDGFRYVSEAIRDGQERLEPDERLLWIRGSIGWMRSYQCETEKTYEGAVCTPWGVDRFLIEPIHGDPKRSDLNGWRLSPDGGRVAYFLRDEADPSVWNLWVRSVTMDDEPRLLVPRTACHCDLNWTPDGRAILYVETEGDPGAAVPVHLIPAEGGEPDELTWSLTAQQLALLSFDAEGRRAVLPVVEDAWRVDFWSLSGFPWQEAGSR